MPEDHPAQSAPQLPAQLVEQLERVSVQRALGPRVTAVHWVLLAMAGSSLVYSLGFAREPTQPSRPVAKDGGSNDKIGPKRRSEEPSSDKDLVLRARIRAMAGVGTPRESPTVAEQQEQSENEEQAALPDFSGRWHLTQVDGEADTLMKELGVALILRMAQGRSRNGRPTRQAQEIVQVGNAFQIRTITQWTKWTFAEEMVIKFLVDGGQQTGGDSSGRDVYLEPRWDGDALVIDERRCRAGKEVVRQLQRWELDSDGRRLTLHTALPKGAVVVQVYEKASGAVKM